MEQKKPQKMNYNELMVNEMNRITATQTTKPTLLLHSCCAPCSSYVLKRLQKFFQITVFFYNSNLFPTQEYELRLKEQKRFVRALNRECKRKQENGEFENQIFHETPIAMKTGKFVPQEFYDFVKGYETNFEGSPRCYLCYMLRLNKAGEVAAKKPFHYFCTTLTVSPYKNAEWINEVGAIVSKKHGVPFLHSDFKKDDGYKKSIEYSKEYHLYRQNYCGCEFSLQAKLECLATEKTVTKQ